ncbi:uncharacterized protein LOC134835419 [Culicoides brevitarsis]|uniref:uncharacterized protein LOC134835419 n=1 Tax=Culicoides brevitarsis TaxID=469753 RepID=UPI00307C22FE
MFDLKICLLDLIKSNNNNNNGHSKTKKPKSSKYGRYPEVDVLQKYNDINIIHFNENMSMVNRMENIKFVPYTRQFKSSPSLVSAFPAPLIGGARNNGRSFREWGVETVSFDFSSDDRMTPTTSGESADERVDFSDSAIQTSSANDSFCTLCTSSFSFDNCENCPENTCGSKCSSEQMHVCGKSKS